MSAAIEQEANEVNVYLLKHKKRAWALLGVLWNASPWSSADHARNGEARLAFRAFAEALEDVAAVRDGAKRNPAEVMDALVLLSAPRIKLLDLLGIETDYFWKLAQQARVFE